MIFLAKYLEESTFMFIFAADYWKNMERNLLIELLEDGEKVSLYSPHFEGEEYSEFEKFLITYKDTYPDDVRQQREKDKVIVVTGTELLGELSFTIDDE